MKFALHSQTTLKSISYGAKLSEKGMQSLHELVQKYIDYVSIYEIHIH